MWAWLWGADETEADQEKNATKKNTMNKQQAMFLGICVLVAGLGWLLAVVGTATDYWQDHPKSTKEAGHFGLFDCGEECPGYITTVKAMLILGILVASAGVLIIGVAMLMLLKNKQIPLIPIAGGIACAVGGLFTIVGASIYTTEWIALSTEGMPEGDTKDAQAEKAKEWIGWSVDVTIAGGVLLLLVGGLVVVGMFIMMRRMR